MKDSQTDVIVIGAGHNGLTSACYLARAGLDVLVVEAAPSIGGMTTTQALIPSAPEHAVNLCALDLAFGYFLDPIVRELDLKSYGYRSVVTDPSYGTIGDEGESICVWRDPRRTADEIRRYSRGDAEAFLDLVRLCDAGIDIVLPLIAADPLRPGLGNAARALGGAARHSRKLGDLAAFATSTANEQLDARFKHPLVRGLLGLIATSVAPLDQPSSGLTLAYWAWVHRFPVGRVVGGSQSLPDALARCLEASGGRIRTSAPVGEILVSAGAATGVRLVGGEELRARAVVAGCDPHQALNRLLPAGVLSDKLAARAASIPTTNNDAMCFKLDLALDGRVDMEHAQRQRADNVDLRTVFLYQGTLEQQADAQLSALQGRLPEFIPYMATVPTAVDPTQAPAGQDTVYVYAFPMPRQAHESWDTLGERAADILVTDLSRFYGGLKEKEIGRFVEPWPLLAERTRATNGQWMHVDLDPFHLGPLRPAIGFSGYKTPVPALFLTGGGSHPGPGMSGLPGKLAAKRVRKWFKHGRG